MKCEIGLRTRNYHVLTGSVLSVWNKVEMAIASSPGSSQQNKMQIIRLRTDQGKRVVGTYYIVYLITYSRNFIVVVVVSLKPSEHLVIQGLDKMKGLGEWLLLILLKISFIFNLFYQTKLALPWSIRVCVKLYPYYDNLRHVYCTLLGCFL